jgi:GNAT superfamily N-acetyltransferase
MAAALKRPALDLTLNIYPGLVTRIIDRPGATLNDAALQKLVADLRQLAQGALPAGALTYGVFSGDRAHLSRVVVTLISDAQTGAPVAFNALAPLPVAYAGERFDLVHLGLVMVDPAYRARGLSSALYGWTTFLLFLRGGLRPFWISNVTQVPSVVGMVSETFSNVWPSPRAPSRRAFAHQTLARQMMARHRAAFGVGDDADFDEEASIIRNAYTGGSDDLKKTFADAPKHRDALYNDWCRDHLDYTRGDDVLQIARMDVAAARRYALAHIPRRSAPALIAAAFFLLLQSLALPFLHWLDPTRPFGALRAREAHKAPTREREQAS